MTRKKLTGMNALKKEFPDVEFRQKSSFQKWGCLRPNCLSESTMEAVCGMATIRCCTNDECMRHAAEFAIALGGRSYVDP